MKQQIDFLKLSLPCHESWIFEPSTFWTNELTVQMLNFDMIWNNKNQLITGFVHHTLGTLNLTGILYNIHDDNEQELKT